MNTTSLPMAVLICATTALLVGCHAEGRGASPSDTELAKACAAEMRKAVGIDNDRWIEPGVPMPLPSDMLGRVWPCVEAHFTRHDVSPLAALINVQGPWQKTAWYGEVCESFAVRFTDQRPLKLKGTDAAERALKRLASDGDRRDTRVYAAIALRFDDPDLAKRVLLREYGNFRLYGGGLPAFDMMMPGPPACGPALNQLGVHVNDSSVNEEVRSLSEASKILSHSGVAVDWQDEQSRPYLAEAANRFNALIRKAVVDGDEKSKQMLWNYQQDGNNPTHLFRAVWDDVKKNWKPPEPDPTEPGLFSPAPDTRDEARPAPSRAIKTGAVSERVASPF